LSPMKYRLYRILEPRWVLDYAAKHYPDRPVRPNCPLGPVPQALIDDLGLQKAILTYRPYRPEVDLLVVGDKELILIEAKLGDVYGALGKLVIYRELVPLTPELRHYRDWPVKAVFLCVKAHDPAKAAAKLLGIELEEWAPTYILEAWHQRNLYWTKPAHELRERRKEVLKRLGFT